MGWLARRPPDASSWKSCFLLTPPGGVLVDGRSAANHGAAAVRGGELLNVSELLTSTSNKLTSSATARVQHLNRRRQRRAKPKYVRLAGGSDSGQRYSGYKADSRNLFPVYFFSHDVGFWRCEQH